MPVSLRKSAAKRDPGSARIEKSTRNSWKNLRIEDFPTLLEPTNATNSSPRVIFAGLWSGKHRKFLSVKSICVPMHSLLSSTSHYTQPCVLIQTNPLPGVYYSISVRTHSRLAHSAQPPEVS